MPSRIPPFFDLFPEDAQPHPFGDTGEGLRFLYLSNRNQVSHLIAEHREGPAFGQALWKGVPMGYATLFILRKLVCYQRLEPGTAAPYRQAAKAVHLRSITPTFGVLCDPRHTAVGGANLIHPIATMSDCKAQALEIAAETGCRTVAAVVEESMSWH